MQPGFIRPSCWISRTTGHITNQVYNNPLLSTMNITAFSACAVSLSIMTAISVDRFLALHCHMRISTLMTKQRDIYTSATLWLQVLSNYCLFWTEMHLFLLWHLQWNPDITICQGSSKIISLYRGIVISKLPI